MYRNKRDGTFEDVTERAGLAGRNGYRHGVAVGDIDNDSDLDLYVTAFGPNTLYRNNGNGTFTDVTAQAGVAGGADEWSTSAGFFDYDRDGDLDLYVVNYLDYRRDDNPYCGFRQRRDTGCTAVRRCSTANRTACSATTATARSRMCLNGPALPIRPGRASASRSVISTRTPTSTSTSRTTACRNFLYRNESDGTFRDVAYGAGVGFDGNGRPQAGMGVDCADVDGNALPEIFVTNLSEELNTLYQNLGGELFEEVSVKAGLGSGYLPLGFGTRMFDADNDGDLDIYVTNGHVIDNIELFRPALPTRRPTCCT